MGSTRISGTPGVPVVVTEESKESATATATATGTAAPALPDNVKLKDLKKVLGLALTIPTTEEPDLENGAATATDADIAEADVVAQILKTLTPAQLAEVAAEKAKQAAERKARLAEFSWTPTKADLANVEAARLAATQLTENEAIDIEPMFSDPTKTDFSANTAMYERLCGEIRGANKIRAALYGIDSVPELVEELRAAVKRGADVQIVVDINPDGTFTYPETEALVKEFGSAVMRVECNSQSAIMHDKFWVFDDKKVWTGSTNINKSAVGKGYNSEISVLLASANLAKVYNAEHAQMWAGKFHSQKTNIATETLPKSPDGVEVQAFFSPTDPVVDKGILPLLDEAEKSIHLQLFHFSDAKIAERLVEAKKRGVDVQLILDATGAGNSATQKNIELLRAAGIPVKVENWGGKQHMKGGLVDGKHAIIGSTNWTASGAQRNDENCLIVRHHPALGAAMEAQFARAYASLPRFTLCAYLSAERLNSVSSLRDESDNDHFGGKDPTLTLGTYVKAKREIDDAVKKYDALFGRLAALDAKIEALTIVKQELEAVLAYRAEHTKDESAVGALILKKLGGDLSRARRELKKAQIDAETQRALPPLAATG